MEIRFDNDVKGNIIISYAVLENVRIEPANSKLKEAIKEIEAEVLREISKPDSELRKYAAMYRKFFWSFNMDPTKFRPSAEALTRRVEKGKGLYSINNAVDIMNAVSIKYGLPICFHDLEKLNGSVKVRLAAKGEPFEAMGTKRTMELVGNEVVVADDKHIIDLGLSTSGCDRTKVTESTKAILAAIYAPRTIDNEYLKKATDELITLLSEYTGGSLVEKRLVTNQDV